MDRGGHGWDSGALVQRLQGWAHGLGFSQIGISGIDLASAEPGLRDWLAAGFHGGMAYMATHGARRARPAELVPGTVSVVTARMDYLPRDSGPDWLARETSAHADPHRAVVSVYARGRDYHKVLRSRLARLAEQLAAEVGPVGHRVFTDSAPVLEVEIATRAGLGWRGKHTLALTRDAGSTFFLGEIFVDLALPPTPASQAHCGRCTSCIDVCPTQAIVAPYRLDARRCISYLTIEHDGAIPEALREPLGNRVFGCDDCQLACPWNKYAQRSTLPDFDTRAPLGEATLLELWSWDEDRYLRSTQGSPLRRAGWQRWRRNLAVALGNAWRVTADASIAQALASARDGADAVVREHIDWALAQRAGAGPGPDGGPGGAAVAAAVAGASPAGGPVDSVPAQPPADPDSARQTPSHTGKATIPSSVDTVTRPAA